MLARVTSAPVEASWTEHCSETMCSGSARKASETQGKRDSRQHARRCGGTCAPMLPYSSSESPGDMAQYALLAASNVSASCPNVSALVWSLVCIPVSIENDRHALSASSSTFAPTAFAFGGGGW